MVNVRKLLAEDLAEGVKAAFESGDLPKVDEVPKVVMDRPEKGDHGDFASPIALVLAKTTGKKPMEIVEIIVSHMPKKEYVGRIKAVPPGFVNIWLNPGWLTSRLDNVIEDDLCSTINIGEGKSVNLEFISANPTGPLTLGNIRTAFSVDTLGNALTCAGFDVTREYYFNDAGGQVKKIGESVLRKSLIAQSKKIEFPEDLYQGKYVDEVAEKVSEWMRENEGRDFTEEDLDNKEVLEKVSQETVRLLMDAIKVTIKDDLKISFDVWTSEKELHQNGKVSDAMDKLKEKGELYEKEGATYLKTTKYGDTEDRVVIKSDGEFAYIAPDVGYHQDKYDRDFDLIFTFVGADHQGHLPKVKAAMESLGNDVSKLHMVTAQWMGIIRDGKPVKLSKRAGEVYGPKDLIDEVGYDAARFFMIQHRLDTHMNFDIDLAKEKSERNPVYYIQYAYVRLQSILRKAKEEGVIEKLGEEFDWSDSPSLTHTMEIRLMHQLYRFPEVIENVALHFEVHDITHYVSELAKAVHVFYRNVPVLAGDDEKLINSRLQLVLAAKIVLGKSMDLLGIGKPDVM